MPEKKFSVTLKEIIDEFSLETIHLPMDASKLLVIETEINRPGLQLSGFYEYFNNERIQIVGKAEFAYLATMEETVRKEHLEMLFAQHVPCIIITRELPYFPKCSTLPSSMRSLSSAARTALQALCPHLSHTLTSTLLPE